LTKISQSFRKKAFKKVSCANASFAGHRNGVYFFALIAMGAIPIRLDSGMASRIFIRLPNFLKSNFIVCSPQIKRLLFCCIFNVQKKVLAVWRSFAKDQRVNATLQNIDLGDTVAILFTLD
jgi:hypothetical protein